MFKWKSSSCDSLVHLLPTSSSKSAASPTVFYVCRPHLFKSAPSPTLFNDFYVKSSSHYTVSCTFCRPHLPKMLWARQFFTIFMWNRALATVSCIFQKCSERPSFLTCSSGNRALATASCTFCRPHLPKVVRTWQFFTFLVSPGTCAIGLGRVRLG